MRRAAEQAGNPAHLVQSAEGERDEAPNALHRGRSRANGTGPQRSTSPSTRSKAPTLEPPRTCRNALTVIAMGPARIDAFTPRRLQWRSERIGPGFRPGVRDASTMSPSETRQRAGLGNGMLDDRTSPSLRPRTPPLNQAMIDELRPTGCAHTPDHRRGRRGRDPLRRARDPRGIDMYMGESGAPEGVLAAAR